MNQEILKCQVYLHPDKPVDVTSADVKQYLKELGWEEGDKIPEGMPEYTTHVLKAMGKPVTVKSLDDMFKDETVIATLKSALNKVKLVTATDEQVEERVKEVIPDPSRIHEGAREDLIKAVRDKVRADMKNEAATVDVQEDDAFDGLEDVGSVKEDDAVSLEEEDSASVPATDDESANESRSHICPRCGFDITTTYVPFPVSDEDKINYAYSILGGTDFKKTYSVADGLLQITYKAPTAYVNRLIEDQIKYDTNDNVAIDYDQSYMNSVRYGLAASLNNVKSTVGLDSNLPVPDLFEDRFVTPGRTNLIKFTKYVEDNIIRSGTREVLFRETYSDFIKLLVRLQYDLRSENFIKAVLDKN